MRKWKVTRIRSNAAGITAAVLALLAWTGHGSAASQQFNCVLTDNGAQGSSASQPVVVVFDEDAKTLQAQTASQNYSFGNVSISNVSISGDIGAVSLGIDRSSLGMVWQQYGADKVVTEYGQCQQSADHGAADTH
jgi:hypothetical protein